MAFANIFHLNFSGTEKEKESMQDILNIAQGFLKRKGKLLLTPSIQPQVRKFIPNGHCLSRTIESVVKITLNLLFVVSIYKIK